MAKIWQRPELVYSRVHSTARSAAEETLALTQRKINRLPLATGRLASTYRIEVEEVSPDGVSQFIRSDSVYAGPVERGAWSRGRGPHISRKGANRYLVRKTITRDFGRRLTKGLRSA